MKKSKQNSNITMTDDELIILLREISVQSGFRIPETAEEVCIFEKAFSCKPHTVKAQPTLKEVLALAQKVDNSSGPIAIREESQESYNYLMAARNGTSIKDETIQKLENAVSKKKASLRNDQ